MNKKIVPILKNPSFLIYFMTKSFKDGNCFVVSFLRDKKKESELFLTSFNQVLTFPTNYILFSNENKTYVYENQPISTFNNFAFCVNSLTVNEEKNIHLSYNKIRKTAEADFPLFLSKKKNLRLCFFSNVKARCLTLKKGGYSLSFMGSRAFFLPFLSKRKKTFSLRGWFLQNIPHYGSLMSFKLISHKLKWDVNFASYFHTSNCVHSIYLLKKTKISKISRETSSRKR